MKLFFDTKFNDYSDSGMIMIKECYNKLMKIGCDKNDK